MATRAESKAATREDLLDAARRVFLERGYHGASLELVAREAGYTKGAVYSNFANKDELFLAVFEDRYAQEQTEMRRVLTEDEQPYELGDHSEVFNRVRSVIDRTWDDDWTALYLAFVLYARRNADAAQKLAEVVQRQRDMTTKMLEDAYESVEYEPDLPVEVIATISVALFDGLALGRLADPRVFDDAMLTHFLDFTIASIGANRLADDDG